MAGLLQLIGEALQTYWLSPLSLTVLAVCIACIGTLLYVFVTNARNAKLRVSLLTGLYALSIFFWTFVAGSLVLCVSQARMVAYAKDGVPLAVFGAVVGGLGASAAISALVWKYGNGAVLRKFAPRTPSAAESWLGDYVRAMAKFERVRDELESVVAHELMHLKHHDAEFKVFSRVLSRILFFDPFSKFFDPAIHREREYLADETAGRSTGKPASLASALLKIAERGVGPKAAWGLSIYGIHRGIFSRYPPLNERVQRLLLLSDLVPGPAK